MTQQEVHNAFCKATDTQKMDLAIQCQLNGTSVQNVELVLANVITGIEKSLKPVIQNYKYLEGK